ncbi:MAG: hypothetical protein SVU32_06505 [Candidatus Nanohaloarchaea archaeon]|nr:hypothetical protein [Candidatus Nanohaloarchaea archaeon]
MGKYRPVLLLIAGSVLQSIGSGTLVLFAFQERFIPVYAGVIMAVVGYYIAQFAEKIRVQGNTSYTLLGFSEKGSLGNQRPRLNDITALRSLVTPSTLYRGALGIVGVVPDMLGYFASHRAVNNTWI